MATMLGYSLNDFENILAAIFAVWYTKLYKVSCEERIFQPRNSDDMTQKKARWIRFIPPSDVGYESNELCLLVQ